jgi:protein kinase C substrate 80K-H
VAATAARLEAEHAQMLRDGLEARRILVERAANMRSDSARASADAQAKNETMPTDMIILELDYDDDDVFLSLRNECVQLNLGEYTFEYCIMVKASQISNNGGSYVNLGYFTAMEKTTTSDGILMLHKMTGGQKCWNGPERTANIKIACGSENKIVKVSEPQKCTYEFNMLSPAVCRDLGKSGKSEKSPQKEYLWNKEDL